MPCGLSACDSWACCELSKTVVDVWRWFGRWRPSLSSIRVPVWPCSITTVCCRSCHRRRRRGRFGSWTWPWVRCWPAAITTGSAASHDPSAMSCFARRPSTTSRSSSSRDCSRPSKPRWPNSTHPQSSWNAPINLRRNLFDHELNWTNFWIRSELRTASSFSSVHFCRGDGNRPFVWFFY